MVIDRTTPWLAYRRPNPQARLRLFCLPYAGGGATIYRAWSNYLPALIEVCPVQLPGRENRIREAPFTKLVPLIKELTAALQPFLDIPFAVFGHSVGAQVAYEFARYLYAAGLPGPTRLFVSACPAPEERSDAVMLHMLPDHSFIEAVRRMKGTPEEVFEHPELMQVFLPILRADFSLIETYEFAPSAPLECPISAFGGLQDVERPREVLERWRQHTSGEFRLRMFRGDHFYLRDACYPLLGAIVHDLASAL